MTVLTFRSEHLHLIAYLRGGEGRRASASFPGNQGANQISIPPATGTLPLPAGPKPAAGHCPQASAAHCEVSLQDFASDV